MKTGVKFCGHCAPRRDMAILLEDLKQETPDITYVYQSQDPETDALLVLCACQSACATIPEYTGPIIVATPFAVNNRQVDDAGLVRSIKSSIEEVGWLEQRDRQTTKIHPGRFNE